MTLDSSLQHSSLSLAERYHRVRRFTDRIAEPLSAEDCMVQSMPDVSPTRWHLGHTSWFFETFLLGPQPGYQVFDEQFCYLFNSYYNTIGKQFPRANRGMISRPRLARIRDYRAYIDHQMNEWFGKGQISDEQAYAIEVGLHHEQQHQELMLTDIKHVLSCNPTMPRYEAGVFGDSKRSDRCWVSFGEGLHEIGHPGLEFAFDNESPRHRVFLEPFSIASQPITCGQFIRFIEDGGYQRPEHWLSLGWSTVGEREWDAPLYWVKRDGGWMVFTLSGLVPVNPDWPVCHLSYFEADAFARWSGHRLPTEFEWEVASAGCGGNQFADRLLASGSVIHPTVGSSSDGGLSQMFGGVWEWTSSSYAAYPGYAPPKGALGEYNGKFMCNQYVLRGGSVATSSDHIRQTYRNFFPPDARWQFNGFRLAK